MFPGQLSQLWELQRETDLSGPHRVHRLVRVTQVNRRNRVMSPEWRRRHCTAFLRPLRDISVFLSLRLSARPCPSVTLLVSLCVRWLALHSLPNTCSLRLSLWWGRQVVWAGEHGGWRWMELALGDADSCACLSWAGVRAPSPGRCSSELLRP